MDPHNRASTWTPERIRSPCRGPQSHRPGSYAAPENITSAQGANTSIPWTNITKPRPFHSQVPLSPFLSRRVSIDMQGVGQREGDNARQEKEPANLEAEETNEDQRDVHAQREAGREKCDGPSDCHDAQPQDGIAYGR